METKQKSKYLEDETLLSPSGPQVYCSKSGLMNTPVAHRTAQVIH